MRPHIFSDLAELSGTCQACRQRVSMVSMLAGGECKAPLKDYSDALKMGIHWGYVPNPPTPVRCECGSDKVKLPTHSSWCPKS